MALLRLNTDLFALTESRSGYQKGRARAKWYDVHTSIPNTVLVKDYSKNILS